MFRRNHLRMPHRIDILEKTQTEMPSGQKVASWDVVERIECFYVPHRAIIRVSPTSEETEKIKFFFPSDADVDFKTRLSGMTDREGNIVPHLADKILEIVAVNHFSGYGGKPHHIQVVAETVIE